MVKLKRLKINKYRNVRPGTELHFDDGYNLLLGKNGTGKTTLLALIQAAVSLDFAAIEASMFDLEFELVDGTVSLVIRLGHHDYPQESPQDQPWRGPNLTFQATLNVAREHIRITGTTAETTLHSAMPSADTGAGTPSFKRGFLTRAVSGVLPHGPSTWFDAALSLDYRHVARFDEGLDAFLAMTGRTPVNLVSGAARVTAFKVLERSNLPVRFDGREFTPAQIAELIPLAQTAAGGQISVRPGSVSTWPSSINFLAKVADLIGASEAFIKPEVQAINQENRQLRTFDVKGFSFDFTRAEGHTINHDLLSYGQKRLLAFFYYLAATDDVVIADELVNGLHHRWIQACMEAIGDRQAFLTSQNPLLFDYIPDFESASQVQSSFITCKTEIVDGAEQLVWENMTTEDAERFFESYQAEIQPVGEILITKGLW